MRHSLKTKYHHEQQSQEQSEEESEQEFYKDDLEKEQKAKKKPVPIPRFVKNQIHEIDTEHIVLNISRTQYEVVEQVAKQLGWNVQKSKKSQKWDIMWIDSHIEAHDLFRLNDHQKISHFPAIYVLTRKNFLGRSLMKMRNYFPGEYDFFPSTWSIPADMTELLRFDEKSDKKDNEQNNFYIYKPEAMAQGKGIKLCENVTLLSGKIGIVQQYINNPYLIQNLKFDLRIYVLIMGYDPLRIFIYDEGLGRFATEKYQKVKKKNMKDVHMHLTNYAINKNNKNFIFNNSDKAMDKGHKRSLTAIYSYLQSKNIDTQKLKDRIDQMIIKTLIVGQPMIAHTYGLAQADNFANDLCFQILGFDVLINQDLNPVLLEVNHTPSFKTDTPLDKFIKKSLIHDTLNLLNVNITNKKQKIELKREQIELRSQRKLIKMKTQQKQQLKKKRWKQRDEYELANLGNFRKIFPNANSYKYKEMIQISNKIFNEANGFKNKSGNPKMSFTSRPKSQEKGKRKSEQSNLEKEIIPLKDEQDIKVSKQIQKKHKMKSLRQTMSTQVVKQTSKQTIKQFEKFPTIGLPKVFQVRNISGCTIPVMKQQSPIKRSQHRLERTSSYQKTAKLQTLQSLNMIEQQISCSAPSYKGSYIPAKLIEMDEPQSPQKSTQLINSSSHIPLIHQKFTIFNKIKTFDDVAHEASLQIASLSHTKPTYENLLNSLSSTNNFREENKLRPIRK